MADKSSHTCQHYRGTALLETTLYETFYEIYTLYLAKYKREVKL